MKRLGVVENIAYDGTVLVRSESAPERGARVVDERNHTLGRVVRVFGPVREPLVNVRPEGKLPLSVLGSEVYLSEGNHAQRKGRRGGRRH